MSTTPARAPRSDALANRGKILDSARKQFASEGTEVSMNEIARRAGVGVATLYRHFPQRDDLVAAIYAEELASLGGAVDEFLASMTPDDALTAWGARLLEYAITKRGLGAALLAMRERGDVRVDARGVLIDSMNKLLAAGREAGTIVDDVTGEDLMTAISGLWVLPVDEQYPDRARRLLALVFAGLRSV
ncbi:MAG: helix-turn-helix domain containing protein [Patulibacter minatonensis]